MMWSFGRIPGEAHKSIDAGRALRRARSSAQSEGPMRIELIVPCSHKELWQALIQNGELTERGATLRLVLSEEVFELAAQITRYESSRLLECCCDGNLLRWRLEAQGEETTHLSFTYIPQTRQRLAPDIIARACFRDVLALIS